MTATLTLARRGTGIELRRGTFEIVLDGSPAGSIDWHQDVELALAPGPHTLRVRAGRYSSRAAAFAVRDGDALRFRCHGAMVWPRYVASILAPGLGLSLRRE